MEKATVTDRGTSSVTYIFHDQFSKKDFKSIFRRKSYIGIDIHDFCLNIEILFTSKGVVFKSKKYDIEHITISSVIYFPYSYESISFDPLKGDSTYKFGKRQYASLISYFEIWMINNLKVVNSPVIGRLWSNKPFQLEKIAQYLKEYCLPSEIKSDYLSIRELSVVKHLSESRIISKNNDSFAFRLNTDILKELLIGKALPFINQEFVSASHEYRCYIWGKEKITLRFQRTNTLNAEGCVDIHYAENLDKVEIFEMTQSISNMIDKVKKITELTVFCVDFFIINEDIKLLEINPLFSWNWLPNSIKSKIEISLIKFSKFFEINK